MKIPSSIESQGIQSGPPPNHAQKMHAMAHAHLTSLAATAKATQTAAVGATAGGPTTEQIAYAIQGFGDLASIDSLVNQYNQAGVTPAQQAQFMADIVWYAQDLIQNCMPNADPTAATTLSKMAADFTYTTDPTTGKVTVSNMTTAQMTQFEQDWSQNPSGLLGDQQAWTYIGTNKDVLSQTFSTQYPLAALGLIMLQSDNLIITTAMQGEYQYYHNGKGPLHYDDWLLNQNWDSTMNYGQLFPYMILTAAYLACCPQTPPYGPPSSADYTAMLSRFQDALPPVSLINSKFPTPATPPETTYYQQMLDNLSDDITNQNLSYPFMQFPTPPFGPVQNITFTPPANNPYDPSDPSYQSFDPVYESIWQDLQSFLT